MQNWKKGCVFGQIDKFWKGHDGQIKKNACKNAYLRSIFIPEKYVIRVLFVCLWMSLIPPLAIQVAPPGSRALPLSHTCLHWTHHYSVELSIHCNKLSWVSYKFEATLQNLPCHAMPFTHILRSWSTTIYHFTSSQRLGVMHLLTPNLSIASSGVMHLLTAKKLHPQICWGCSRYIRSIQWL